MPYLQMVSSEVERKAKPPLKKSKTLSSFYDNVKKMRREHIVSKKESQQLCNEIEKRRLRGVTYKADLSQACMSSFLY